MLSACWFWPFGFSIAYSARIIIFMQIFVIYIRWQSCKPSLFPSYFHLLGVVWCHESPATYKKVFEIHPVASVISLVPWLMQPCITQNWKLANLSCWIHFSSSEPKLNVVAGRQTAPIAQRIQEERNLILDLLIPMWSPWELGQRIFDRGKKYGSSEWQWKSGSKMVFRSRSLWLPDAIFYLPD